MRFLLPSVALCLLLAAPAKANPSAQCAYRIAGDGGGHARIRIAYANRTLINVVISGVEPNTLYTVWSDFRIRPDKTLPPDHPALAAGVGPTVPLTTPFTNGVGRPDANSFVTDPHGRGVWSTLLDYPLDDAPTVSGELAMAGANRLGGGWLPEFTTDPTSGASLQVLDADGMPLIERGVIQGLTIVRHARGDVSHGATPGVGGVNHFPAFSGNFPNRCRRVLPAS